MKTMYDEMKMTNDKRISSGDKLLINKISRDDKTDARRGGRPGTKLLINNFVGAHKNGKSIRRAFAAMLLFAALVAISCQTARTDNAQTMTQVVLSNGIPLYVQKNTANRTLALAVIVKGGTAYLSPETSGLESALFSMMTYGSEHYSYDELQRLGYEMSFSISPSVSREGAIFYMTCIDYYFDDVLPIFADAFINPAYNEAQYRLLMTDYAQSLQSLQTEPESMLGYAMTQEVFKNHPYAVSSAVRPYSIENITIENMRRLHEADMDARRMMIVAVGNFDAQKLAKRLDATFGAIPAQTYELKSADVPPLTISGEPLVITSDAAAGTGFLEREAAGPSIFDDDMMSASIAASMYSETLFNVVREKYGACYGPSASITPMRAGMASIYMYRVSDLENIVSYEKEAQDIFASGRVIDGKNDDGSYQFATVEARLEGYKNQYINSFYDSSVTNGGVASRLAYSLLMFGNPYDYDAKITGLSNVTAQDVEAAFRKYWVENDSRWFGIVGPADKDKVRF